MNLTADVVRWASEHRIESIVIEGFVLDREEVQYLIEVLEHLEFDRERYITDRSIVSSAVEGFIKDISPRDVADDLKETNSIVGEYA